MSVMEGLAKRPAISGHKRLRAELPSARERSFESPSMSGPGRSPCEALQKKWTATNQQAFVWGYAFVRASEQNFGDIWATEHLCTGETRVPPPEPPCLYDVQGTSYIVQGT